MRVFFLYQFSVMMFIVHVITIFRFRWWKTRQNMILRMSRNSLSSVASTS